jgi:hypothetical protein
MARLREAAELPVEDRPESEFAVLVLFRPGEPALSSADRDLLWKAFQVPVYSLLVGFDGTLLGHECEAHRGWHASANAVFEELKGFVYVTSLADTSRPTMRLNTGIRGKLERSLCDCGRPGVRVQAMSAGRPILPDTSLPLAEIVDVY